ncbi:MAG: N-acetylmuramoyl-L-alanine amidase [Actinomycetota bacterium]|nr:N-acetylmuramoyl-L-alanine amidase [Actinomycetota bacterium]
MKRRDFLRLTGAGLAGAVLLGTAGATGTPVLAQTGSSLKAQFESAAKEYDVPVELLLAMGYVNTLWEMPPPYASDYHEGDPEGRGAYGIMQLLQNPSRDSLGRAASLTGLSEEKLKNSRAANVRGGVAVLADIRGASKPAELNGWQEAVADYGDTQLYAQEVFEALKSGASLTISTGERLELAPQEGVEVPQPFTTASGGADYGRAHWRPANRKNYTNAHRGAGKVDTIVIHVAQGPYSATVDWFQNPKADASAHYVVSRRGGVAQCVHNADIAWHAGRWKTNKKSIGIEHAGYIGNPRSFTKRMYQSSARLSAYLCRRFNIPVDRGHIIGHNQVAGCPGPGGGVGCHKDPGKYWNWDRYMRLISHYR